MVNKVLFLVTLFVSALLSGQENLKGYYITNSGETVNGYFMNGDFANINLLKFSVDAQGNFDNIDAETITEYGVDGDLKYQKHTVSLDNSHLTVGIVSRNKNPEWVSKTLFLNVVLEGDASLYSYYSTNGTIFFYKVTSKSLPITQLVYKKYMASQSSEAENNHYKQQLFNDVRCEGQTIEDFYRVGYKQASLTKVFYNYNTCTGKTVTTYTATKSNKLKVDFTVFAGLNSSKLTFNGGDPAPDNNKDTKAGLGFGGEIALVLPSRKVSFFLKADYEKVSGAFVHEAQTNIRYSKDTYIIDMSLVNAYLGARYNFLISPKNTLFVDAAFASGFPSGTYEHNYYSTTQFSTTDNQRQKFDLGKDTFWNIGVGYMFNNKYGVDLRIDTVRNFFNDVLTFQSLTTESTRLALNLRYTIN